MAVNKNRFHYWSFLLDEEGQPIENASIWIYLAGTSTPAELYPSESGNYQTDPLISTFESYEDGDESESNIEIIKTDEDGFFEFWVGNENETNGYGTEQKFKIKWYKAGIAEGEIDYINIITYNQSLLSWNGPWMPYTEYSENDIVSYAYSSSSTSYATSAFICQSEHTSDMTTNTPGSGSSWDSYWELFAGISGLEDYVAEEKKLDVTLNDSDTTITLTTSDMNGVLLVENAAAVNVNLPSIDSDDIGSWIKIHKMGAGDLTINRADSDAIEDGTAVANTTAAQTWANIELFVATASKWKFNGPPLGNWATS
jgi:hypothetical protein